MTECDIRRLAPPAPACFSARDIWLEYLITSQADKAKAFGTRPFTLNSEWNPRFSFCADCTRGHEAAMRAEGRCVRPRRVIRLEVLHATAAA